MQKSKLLKVLTLTGFVILISGFVAFRGGVFNNQQNDVLAENINQGLAVDSPPAKKVMTKADSIRRRENMMSSSKSGGVFFEDDVKQNQTTTQTASSGVNPTLIVMPSSKSAGVFRPSDIKTLSVTPAKTTTVSPIKKTETITPQQKKSSPNNTNQNKQK